MHLGLAVRAAVNVGWGAVIGGSSKVATNAIEGNTENVFDGAGAGAAFGAAAALGGTVLGEVADVLV